MRLTGRIVTLEVVSRESVDPAQGSRFLSAAIDTDILFRTVCEHDYRVREVASTYEGRARCDEHSQSRQR